MYSLSGNRVINIFSTFLSHLFRETVVPSRTSISRKEDETKVQKSPFERCHDFLVMAFYCHFVYIDDETDLCFKKCLIAKIETNLIMH